VITKDFFVKFCAVASGNHPQEESANLATGQVEIYCLNMAISGRKKILKIFRPIGI
jgi:hypothetical protein